MKTYSEGLEALRELDVLTDGLEKWTKVCNCDCNGCRILRNACRTIIEMRKLYNGGNL